MERKCCFLPVLCNVNQFSHRLFSQGMKAARMFSTGEVTEGTVCCCVREEQCYRVKVKEMLEHRLLVEYLDYGNKELVEATSLRKELEGEKLFRLPPQVRKKKQPSLLGYCSGNSLRLAVDRLCAIVRYTLLTFLYLRCVRSGVTLNMPGR